MIFYKQLGNCNNDFLHFQKTVYRVRIATMNLVKVLIMGESPHLMLCHLRRGFDIFNEIAIPGERHSSKAAYFNFP